MPGRRSLGLRLRRPDVEVVRAPGTGAVRPGCDPRLGPMASMHTLTFLARSRGNATTTAGGDVACRAGVADPLPHPARAPVDSAGSSARYRPASGLPQPVSYLRSLCRRLTGDTECASRRVIARRSGASGSFRSSTLSDWPFPWLGAWRALLTVHVVWLPLSLDIAAVAFVSSPSTWTRAGQATANRRFCLSAGPLQRRPAPEFRSWWAHEGPC
jgi:hypothetical protein